MIRLALSKKLNWDILILICSPLCLLFIPVNIFNSGRKEIILLALILYFVSGKTNKIKKVVLFIAFLIGLFIHELYYFYLPFVIATYILKTKELDLKYLGTLFILSTAIMFILFFCGGEINQGQSLDILKHRGITLDRWNIFNYDAPLERKNMLLAYKSYILFALEFLFMTVLSFLFVKKYLPEKLKLLKIFIVISIIWVSPLYYLGADWFRWNHIYSLLLLILIICALPDNHEKNVYLQGKFNTSLFLVNILFFLVFYIHIIYDTSGNSTERSIQFIENKLYFIKKIM
ncbi:MULTISPECIES: hypothetical protein [unclassified Chryseobacterium]|uniref:hypothetical protein n=1 Tax=unclassified Chryseobacterium TaxID=2593645 RepID=UPI00301A2A93